MGSVFASKLVISLGVQSQQFMDTYSDRYFGTRYISILNIGGFLTPVAVVTARIRDVTYSVGVAAGVIRMMCVPP